MLSTVLGILSGTATVAVDIHPPGAVIDEAIVVDIPDEGFTDLATIIGAVLPPRVDLDSVEERSGDCGWLGSYAYGIDIEGLWVELEIIDAVMTPVDGRIDLDITLEVMVNDSSDKFDLTTHLLCISDTCDAYVEPFEANIDTSIALDLVENDDGTMAIDATVGEMLVDYSLESAQINLDSCAIGTIEDIFNFFGGSLYDLILPVLDPILQEQVEDLGPELEETIEEALNDLSINEELEVEDTLVYLDLEPTDISIDPLGMRLVLGASVLSEDSADCIAPYHPGGSLATPTSPPEIGDFSPEITDPPAASVHISDDFLNQLFFGLWEGGLLCYTIDEELTGFPLDTSILGLLAGDAFDELFPENRRLDIETLPQQPPLIDLDSDHDFSALVTDLGLDFGAELDHRMVRVLQVSLAVDAGVDVGFDEGNGILNVGIDLDSDAITTTVAYNEVNPDANGVIQDNFGSVFETLAGSLLGELAEDISFGLPAYEGIGLTSMELGQNGTEGDWLGAYAGLGEVAYEGTGCDDDEGCDSGCATSVRNRNALGFWVFPLLLFWIRRRTDGC